MHDFQLSGINAAKLGQGHYLKYFVLLGKQSPQERHM